MAEGAAAEQRRKREEAKRAEDAKITICVTVPFRSIGGREWEPGTYRVDPLLIDRPDGLREWLRRMESEAARYGEVVPSGFSPETSPPFDVVD